MPPVIRLLRKFRPRVVWSPPSFRVPLRLPAVRVPTVRAPLPIPAWRREIALIALAAVAALAVLSSVSTPPTVTEAPFEPRPVAAGEPIPYLLSLKNPSPLPVFITGVTARVHAPLWVVSPDDPSRPPAVGQGSQEVRLPVWGVVWPYRERAVSLTLLPLEPGDLALDAVSVHYLQGLASREAGVVAAWRTAVEPADPAPGSFTTQGTLTGGGGDTRDLQLVDAQLASEGSLTRLELHFAPAGEEVGGWAPRFAVQRVEGDWLGIRLEGVDVDQVPQRVPDLDPVAAILEHHFHAAEPGAIDWHLKIQDLAEYRAHATEAPASIVVEWRSGVPGRDWVYEVRVDGAGDPDLLTEILASLPDVSASVTTQQPGGSWSFGPYMDRESAERLSTVLRATGYAATVHVVED